MVDASYTTAEEYCDDYYSSRIDQIEEAVVLDYLDALIAQIGSSASDAYDTIASIDALCSQNGTNATDPGETVSALFSIRFTAYASALFSRDDGSTLYTVKETLNTFFQSKVDTGDWDSDRIAQATDASWSEGSERRLEDSAAAQVFIFTQSVLSVETTVVETLNPTSAPSFWPTSLPSPSPSGSQRPFILFVSNIEIVGGTQVRNPRHHRRRRRPARRARRGRRATRSS